MCKENEYQSLRTELLEVSGRQLTILTLAFTVTAALVGWTLESSSDNPLVVLTALIPLSFAGWQLVAHAYSIMRIASYIRYFLETGNEDLNWESYMREFRNHTAKREYPTLSRFSWPAYEHLLIVVGWLCIAIAILAAGANARACETYVTAAVAVLWLVFSVWLLLRMRMAVSGELDEDLDEIWAGISAEDPNRWPISPR